MAWDLIDLLSGSAGTTLTGHVPTLGTTAWANDSADAYVNTGTGTPVSSILFDGAGFSYNGLGTTGSSVMLWPGSYVGSSHVIRATFKFLSVVTPSGSGSVPSAGITLYTTVSPSLTNCRFYYDMVNLRWVIISPGGYQSSNYAFPAAGTVVEVEIVTSKTGTTNTYLCTISTDAGVTWTTLFGGTFTDSSAGSNPLRAGLWYDDNVGPTTGVHVGNLRVGPSGTAPTLTVSPTTASNGTPLTIAVAGLGTAYQPGTPGLPAFTVSGGTGPAISGQVVTGFAAGSFTLNPGSAAGNLTITDPSGGTATIAVSAAVATAFAITPSSGICAVGVASGTFAVTPNAALAAGETVAITDDLGNTLATLHFASGATAGQTFSVTAVSGQIGNRTLTATATPALGTAPTAALAVYASLAVYQSSVAGFPASPTPGYQVAINGGSYGSIVTAGITNDCTGTYSAQVQAPGGSLVKVLWCSGSTPTALDSSPLSVVSASQIAAALATFPLTIGTNNDKTGYVLATAPASPASVAAIATLLGSPANGSVSADVAALAAGAGYYDPATVTAVNSPTSITVSFAVAAPPVATLATAWCNNLSSARSPAKAAIATATSVDATHLTLTFASPFPAGVGDLLTVG